MMHAITSQAMRTSSAVTPPRDRIDQPAHGDEQRTERHGAERPVEMMPDEAITMVCDALGLDAAALAAVVRRANGRCG
jgi:hypothetical protein